MIMGGRGKPNECCLFFQSFQKGIKEPILSLVSKMAHRELVLSQANTKRVVVVVTFHLRKMYPDKRVH